MSNRNISIGTILNAGAQSRIGCGVNTNAIEWAKKYNDKGRGTIPLPLGRTTDKIWEINKLDLVAQVKPEAAASLGIPDDYTGFSDYGKTAVLGQCGGIPAISPNATYIGDPDLKQEALLDALRNKFAYVGVADADFRYEGNAASNREAGLAVTVMCLTTLVLKMAEEPTPFTPVRFALYNSDKEGTEPDNTQGHRFTLGLHKPEPIVDQVLRASDSYVRANKANYAKMNFYDVALACSTGDVCMSDVMRTGYTYSAGITGYCFHFMQMLIKRGLIDYNKVDTLSRRLPMSAPEQATADAQAKKWAEHASAFFGLGRDPMKAEAADILLNLLGPEPAYDYFQQDAYDFLVVNAARNTAQSVVDLTIRNNDTIGKILDVQQLPNAVYGGSHVRKVICLMHH